MAVTPAAAVHPATGEADEYVHSKGNPMDKLLSELVERLRLAHPENLISVILYGSAASGDYQGPFSDLNVFCVVARLDTSALSATEGVVRWWRDKGNPSPLLMTLDEMRGSTDCFPIEFHDMRERRRVLFGDDVVEGLTVDEAFYRARVEYELRAKMIRLRQKAAGVLSDRDLLIRLMEDSVSTFCILGRHALRLVDGEAPWSKREIVAALEFRFGLASQPFYTLLDLREGKLKSKSVEPVLLFEEYLAQVNRLTDAVDRLER